MAKRPTKRSRQGTKSKKRTTGKARTAPKKGSSAKRRKPTRKGTAGNGQRSRGTVNAYLVAADADRAIEFYKRAFGAKEKDRSLTPDGKVMHAEVRIGDTPVFVTDEFPGAAVKAPMHTGGPTAMIHINSNKVDELWDRAVSAGARVVMPLENQFWGERYGQLADPEGHVWSLSQQVKMSKAERQAKEREAMAMMGQRTAPGETEPDIRF